MRNPPTHRRKALLESEHYQKILHYGLVTLRAVGRFEQAQLLKGAGYHIFSGINWHVIREELETERWLNERLVPVRAELFQASPKALVERPKWYVAGIGRGSRAAGYVRASYMNGVFAQRKIDHESSKGVGSIGNAEDIGQSLENMLIPYPSRSPISRLPFSNPIRLGPRRRDDP